MDIFEEIRKKYPDEEIAFPGDWEKPQLEEIRRIERIFNIHYSDEFIRFQLIECHCTPMWDFAFDEFGWANPNLDPEIQLFEIVKEARKFGAPPALAPFKSLRQYYCCETIAGEVVLWNGTELRIEPGERFKWQSFGYWLESTFENE